MSVIQFPLNKSKITEHLETFKQLYRNRGRGAAYNYVYESIPEQLWEQMEDDINKFVTEYHNNKGE